METWSVHRLFQQAIQSLDSQSADDLKAYAQRLIQTGLPVVFTLRHLSKITSIDYSLLRASVERRRESANYRMFAIKKRSGGRRHIHAVTGDLFRVQQFINSEILQKLSPHPASFAFHSSGGIRSCASMHCGARWIFQFDLRNFFYSVTEADAYAVFKDAGYRPLLAFELARLCTTTRLPENLREILWQDRCGTSSKNYKFYADISGRVGVLPQGAPTSPMLSNLAARRLDLMLAGYANKHKMVYTRYADDLTISASGNLPKGASVGDIQSAVICMIRKSGFRENCNKTRIAGPGSKKIVLGLLVDGDSPKLSKEMYKRIDRHLHAAQKYGIIKVAKHEGFDSPIGFHNHLSGLIAFVKDVDSVRWREFNERFTIISQHKKLN